MPKKLTIKEFATLIDEDYLTASALTKLFVKMGAAVELDEKRAPEGGRGKPSSVFEYQNEVDFVLWDENGNPVNDEVETVEAPEAQPVTTETATEAVVA